MEGVSRLLSQAGMCRFAAGGYVSAAARPNGSGRTFDAPGDGREPPVTALRGAAVACYAVRSDSPEAPMYPLSIRTEVARRLVGLPHVGPYPEIGPIFERLGAVLGAAGAFPAVRGMVMVSYSDPEATPAEKLKSFAGAIMDAAQPCPDGLEERALEAGRYAVLELTGPYAELGRAWGWLYAEGIPGQGEAASAAPCFEVYLNNPPDTAPAALRTDLYAPLA